MAVCSTISPATISAATEIIDLHSALFVRPSSELDASAPPFCFEVYCNNVTFILKAQSERAMRRWVQCIEGQLFRTYLNTESSAADAVNALAKRASSAKNRTLWLCELCAFQNSLQNAKCALCGRAKDNGAQLIDVAHRAHKSLRQTLKAQPNAKAPHSDEEMDERKENATAVARWECKMCTFENVPSLPYCEICGTRRAKPKVL